MRAVTGIFVAVFFIACGAAQAQPAQIQSIREKIIIDTDVGDDVDDAFAVALALKSPEFEILGFTAAFGDTPARARMLDRMLGEAGRGDIPVAMGAAAKRNPNGFSQRHYAEGGKVSPRKYPDAVDFILDQIRRHPGEITLVAVGPLPNVGALIDKDIATFRKLKRVVIMGGAFQTIPGRYGLGAPTAPMPEWNIKNDIASAKKLFAAGVPVVVMPLDSTINLKLHEVARNLLLTQGTPLTDMLAITYQQWSFGTRQPTPTLFDPMTLAWMADPSLCPVTPMHVRVDDAGMTLAEAGTPNAQVCLKSDPEAFLHFYLGRVGKP
jgi:inosine-uridine nucleoside N-ribohydrolase